MKDFIINKRKIIQHYFIASFFFFALTPSYIISFSLPQGIETIKPIFFCFLIGIYTIFTCCFHSKVICKLLRLGLFTNVLSLFLLYHCFNAIFFNPSQYHFLSQLVGLWLLYLLVQIYFRINKWLCIKAICFTILATFLIQVLLGLLQRSGILFSLNPQFKITGGFGNPGPYSIFLSILLLLSISISIYYRNKFKKLFFALLPVQASSIYLLYFCFSRTSWIAFIGAIIILFFILKIGKPKINYTLYISAFCIAFIAITLLLVQTKYNSAVGRLLIWDTSLTMIPQNVLFGIGVDNFEGQYIYYQAENFLSSPKKISEYGKLADTVRYSFNDYLQLFIETGLIGFIIYIITCIFFLVKGTKFLRSYKNSDKVKQVDYCLVKGLVGGVWIILIAGLFSYPLFVFPLKVFFVFSLSVLNSLLYCELNTTQSPSRKFKFSSLFIFLVLGLFISTVNFCRYKALIKWREAKNEPAFWKIDKLKPLYPYLNDSGYFLLELGTTLISVKEYEKAIFVLETAKHRSSNKNIYYELGKAYQKSGNYVESQHQYKLMANALPNLLKPRFLLAKLYYEWGKYALFLAESNYILSFKPKISSTETIQMKDEIQLLMLSLK